MALKRITLPNGEVLDATTYGILQTVSTMLNVNLFSYVTQGSYSTSVAASGKTHSGAGAFDLSGRLGEATLKKAVAAFRQVAVGRGTGWVRYPNGSWSLHAHFVVVTPETSDSAKWQYQAYLKGGDGLTGNGKDNGPRDYVTGGETNTITDGYNVVDGTATIGDNLTTGSVWDNLNTVADVAAFLGNPENLKRIVLFLVGVLIVIIAIVRLTSLDKVVNMENISKVVKA